MLSEAEEAQKGESVACVLIVRLLDEDRGCSISSF